jgi:hypothetical protein
MRLQFCCDIISGAADPSRPRVGNNRRSASRTLPRFTLPPSPPPRHHHHLHCTALHEASPRHCSTKPIDYPFPPLGSFIHSLAPVHSHPSPRHGAVGDAPAQLRRRVQQRVVGRRGGRGEARVGGPPQRDGRAGAGGRRRRPAAAAGDQGAGQVRRRAPRGPRLSHCHVR